MTPELMIVVLAVIAVVTFWRVAVRLLMASVLVLLLLGVVRVAEFLGLA